MMNPLFSAVFEHELNFKKVGGREERREGKEAIGAVKEWTHSVTRSVTTTLKSLRVQFSANWCEVEPL